MPNHTHTHIYRANKKIKRHINQKKKKEERGADFYSYRQLIEASEGQQKMTFLIDLWA